MRIKSFRLFESIDIDLGEIEDLIQSEILDQFDGDISILGIGQEREYKLESGETVVELDFPKWRSGSPFFGIDGTEYRNKQSGWRYLELDIEPKISKLSPIQDSQFVYIMIDIQASNLDPNIDKLSKSFRDCFKRIKSMTGLDQYDISDKKNEFNGIISYSNDFEVTLYNIEVDWRYSIYDDISSVLAPVWKGLEETAETLSFTMILK